MRVLILSGCLLLLPVATGTVFAQGSGDGDRTESSTIIQRMRSLDDVDPAKWGIRNGCIAINRIRNISFHDDQSAIVDMRGGRQILLRLRRNCYGIKREGFIYEAHGRQLCQRFDRLELIHSGVSCVIDSLEPYIPVEGDEFEASK